MIGIDPKTGATIQGHAQLRSRIDQVLTTAIGSRYKQRGFGSKVPHFLGINTSDQNLVLIQAAVLEAFNDPVNGLSDFVLKQAKAFRTESGTRITLVGRDTHSLEKLELEFSI